MAFKGFKNLRKNEGKIYWLISRHSFPWERKNVVVLVQLYFVGKFCELHSVHSNQEFYPLIEVLTITKGQRLELYFTETVQIK